MWQKIITRGAERRCITFYAGDFLSVHNDFIADITVLQVGRKNNGEYGELRIQNYRTSTCFRPYKFTGCKFAKDGERDI